MAFPDAFNEEECAILKAMYEAEDGIYDSYALAQKLNPTVQPGTQPAHLAFTETREATEGLIVQAL
jgi:hypothetical protein